MGFKLVINIKKKKIPNKKEKDKKRTKEFRSDNEERR